LTAAAIPTYATAPVLILVGVAMFQTVTRLSFDELHLAVPAFVTMVLGAVGVAMLAGVSQRGTTGGGPGELLVGVVGSRCWACCSSAGSPSPS